MPPFSILCVLFIYYNVFFNNEIIVKLVFFKLYNTISKNGFYLKAREIVQTYHPPAIAPSGQKKGVLSRAAGKAFLLGLNITSEVDPESTHGEPVYIETSEKQQEETVITLHISNYLYLFNYNNIF